MITPEIREELKRIQAELKKVFPANRHEVRDLPGGQPPLLPKGRRGVASGVFAVGENSGKMRGEISQILPKISTTGEIREKELLGEYLFAINIEGWKVEKVITRTNEFTLGHY